MIQLIDITKSYQSKRQERSVAALNHVNLQVDRSDIFGIVGYSGAGKSTLLRLLNGLELPTSGAVMIEGKDLAKQSKTELRQARQKIGMIFQHFHLLWSRTVLENVSFPLEIAGKPKDEIERRTERLLKRVGLWERKDAYPSQLSGGQKQRVGIARALANDPDILLCDEATSALDPETTASILQLLKEINQETGITMVLITHEMSVVKAICNKVAVMDQGEIVESGNVKDVFYSPQHEVTKRFTKDMISENSIQEIVGLTVKELKELKEIIRKQELDVSEDDQSKLKKLITKLRS